MEKIEIPGLRQDIQFFPSDVRASHGQEWTIYDPLQHRYFRVNAQTRRLMSLWQGGMTADELIASAKSMLNLSIEEQDVAKLYNFLNEACLLQTHQQNNWRQLDQKAEAARKPLIGKLIRGHLFFRVPLIKPSRFLAATEPFVKPIYSPIGLWLIFFFGLTGLYLVSRELPAFTQALSELFSLQSTIGFLIALLFVKLVHEFGHAYAATKVGCRVATMGIAFMVFVPVFYTDISDTWRLSSRKQRILVSSAGIIAELLVASLATFTWAFLEPGLVRDSVLVLATTSWIISIGINLNPFMKFDGYYILSDIGGAENLQSRSFAYTRWFVRQLLFAHGIQAPENLTKRTATFFICYALGTWIYRLVIFTAIVFVVYQYTFKALGILLFALEIWLLLLSPLFQEIREWTTIVRTHFSAKRALFSVAIVTLIVAGFLAPWSTTLRLPAVLQPSDLAQVYPPRPAKIVSLIAQRGQFVEAGDPIMIMEVPRLQSQIEAARIEVAKIKLQLVQSAADKSVRAENIVLQREFFSRSGQLSGLEQMDSELVVRTPVSGRVVQLEENLHAGRWLGNNTLIALISSQSEHIARGYIRDDQIDRLRSGATGVFVPEDLSRPKFEVRLTNTSVASSTTIEIDELLEQSGGPIALTSMSDNNAAPVSPQFQIEFKPTEAIHDPQQVIRGSVLLNGKGQSIAMKFWRQIAKVLVRESVF